MTDGLKLEITRVIQVAVANHQFNTVNVQSEDITIPIVIIS